MKTVTLRLLENGGNFVGLFLPGRSTACSVMHADEVSDLFYDTKSPEGLKLDLELTCGEEIEIDVTARIK